MENNFSHGIVFGYNKIPVENAILEQTVRLGFDSDFTKKCIEANRHNNATTTYYLLLKKFVRGGGVSYTSLGSKHFDPVLIEPPKRIKPAATSLSENSPQDSGVEIPKNLQATLTRRNYMLQKQKIEKMAKDRDSSIDKNKNSIEMYTPQSKEIARRGRSLNSRDRIDSSRGKEDSALLDAGQDLIGKKYRETYGTSIVSKSKERRRRSLKKDKLNASYDKEKTQFNFNKSNTVFNQTTCK